MECTGQSDRTCVSTLSLQKNLSYNFNTHRAILSELFGTKNFGTVYSLISIGTASGGFAINAGLASHFYSKNTVSSGGDDDNNNKCYGVDCYQPTFLICFVLCVLGALGLIGLSRTHKRYAR